MKFTSVDQYTKALERFAKKYPEAVRQTGGENTSWESKIGQKLPA